MSDSQGKRFHLRGQAGVKKAFKKMGAKIFAKRIFCIGISPKTGKPLYVPFEDAVDKDGMSLLVDFEGAFAYAAQKNKENYLGFSDWYVPSIEGLDVLAKCLDLPALRESFSKTHTSYWSCKVHQSLACTETLKTGKIHYVWKKVLAPLRLMRG